MFDDSTLAIALSGIAGTLSLFRLSVDLIVEAMDRDTGKKKSSASPSKQQDAPSSSSSNQPAQQKYGSTEAATKNGRSVSSTTTTEATSLIGNSIKDESAAGDGGGLETSTSDATITEEEEEQQQQNKTLDQIGYLLKASMVTRAVLILVFLIGAFSLQSHTCWYVSGVMFVETVTNARDGGRHRLGKTQRFFYLGSAALLFISGLSVCHALLTTKKNGHVAIFLEYLLALLMVSYPCLVILECKIVPFPRSSSSSSSTDTEKRKATLSREAILILLKPYIWPDATTNTAALNRILVIITWLCVVGTKVCGLVAPLMLGKASTALTRFQYRECIRFSIYFTVLSLLSKLFREGQSLAYLKVAQAAFVQLSEATFHHLHSLSLDWHLKKKLGEVIRSMDRGISACDTLMKYVFLWLMPAIAECILVCIIFATYFQYFPLSLAVFFFVFAYMVMTIVMTLWRKKFRKAVAKSDNDWHDRCTDSLINFETVKYFTSEKYEMERFGEAVSKYQTGSVNVQASLSLLNASQQILFQVCLATSLSLAVMGIKRRIDCCVSTVGCDLNDLHCCSAVSQDVCPGMEMGDFVAVLTYTINLFGPLNFLGSVYNAIVMAVVDLTNLSELLAENADVMDCEDATELPLINTVDPSKALEFQNVFFNYPSQPEHSGLKGMSFTMKRGTVTAIVGTTGAGKTTVSRLLFRFYDVIYGAVKVNGKDVRSVTQKSLRDAIGFVPQATTMFNDTVRANVVYGKKDATQAQLDQVAKDAQLTDFISSLPLGWDTLVGDRGLKLSGGEKQRVAIARCLLKNPPFVVLDEATSALDTLTENSVQLALDRLGADRTCLVIAHRLGTIRNADNIVVLDDGIVAEQGTHDELLEFDGKYAEMWNMQLHSTFNSTNALDQQAVE